MKEELSIDIIGLAGAYSYALDCIEAELVNIKNKHGKRVAYISVCMAEYLAIQGDALQDLAMCALLHDNALTQYITEELERNYVIDIKKDLSVRKTNLHCIYGEKNITKIIKIISGIGLIFMVYCIVIPAILDIPTLVKQEYTVIEGIVESWNYSDEERLEERSISIKDDTGQEKSVIVYSTGIHQGEHLVVEYLPHSKYGIVKERIR